MRNCPIATSPDPVPLVLVGPIGVRVMMTAAARGTYLTLGKQQVVWGEADGLKVLDVVNPQDFREFILDDFDDSRIPLWTAKAEIPIRSATLQLLWIPDPTHHLLPKPDATYEFESNVPQPPPGVPVFVEGADRPGNFITDSDAGAQLSATDGSWDFTLNYLYQYDDIPVLYRTINAAPSVTVDPTYERTHVVGGTFSTAFGNLTVRGELAYKVGDNSALSKLSERFRVLWEKPSGRKFVSSPS